MIGSRAVAELTCAELLQILDVTGTPTMDEFNEITKPKSK